MPRTTVLLQRVCERVLDAFRHASTHVAVGARRDAISAAQRRDPTKPEGVTRDTA
jgi:hypothetical protein